MLFMLYILLYTRSMPADKLFANIYIRLSLVLLIPFLPSTLFSQEDHDHHSHHGIEIATGGGVAFTTEYSGVHPALHLHVIKGLGEWVGAGIGFEAILSQELHKTLGLFVNVKPFDWLDINLGPGILLATETEPAALALNAEMAFIRPIGKKMHGGLLIDFGRTADARHIVAGVHLGIDL